MDTGRFTLGRMQNPVRGFLHGGAALAALVGTVVLLAAAGAWPIRVALLVFGVAMIALFVTSSLYHSIPWRLVWKKRMQRLDHSMIFIFIAATYTPVSIVILDPPLQWVALVVVWAVAAVGVGQHAFFPDEPHLTVALATTLGWLALLLVYPIVQALGWPAAVLAVIGGVFYTIGVVFLVTNRPRLWPRVFSYHELFHVLVIAGTATHFLVTYRYVVPLAT